MSQLSEMEQGEHYCHILQSKCRNLIQLARSKEIMGLCDNPYSLTFYLTTFEQIVENPVLLIKAIQNLVKGKTAEQIMAELVKSFCVREQHIDPKVRERLLRYAQFLKKVVDNE